MVSVGPVLLVKPIGADQQIVGLVAHYAGHPADHWIAVKWNQPFLLTIEPAATPASQDQTGKHGGLGLGTVITVIGWIIHVMDVVWDGRITVFYRVSRSDHQPLTSVP